MDSSTLKKPSAWVPLAMSFTALVLVLSNILVFGDAPREADEGATAHLFQILMAGQVPVVAYFAIRWLPRDPRHALQVLAMQVGAALAACAPVYYFHL